jgi:hypothetical protein
LRKDKGKRVQQFLVDVGITLGEALAQQAKLRAHLRKAGAAMGLILALPLVAALAGAAGMAVSQQSLPLPQWVVAQIETRAAGMLRKNLPGAQVGISGVALGLGRDFAPRFDVQGARVQSAAGAPLLDLPRISASFAPAALLAGPLLLRDVQITGAQLDVLRGADGQLNIVFANAAPLSLSALFDLADQAHTSPLSRDLGHISVQEVTLRYSDAQTGQTWALQSGTLDLRKQAGMLRANLDFAIRGGGDAPALGEVSFSASMAQGSKSAYLRVGISGVPARDLAAQSAPLAFLAVLDAPLSGQMSATLTPQGMAQMQGSFDIGAGSLSPSGAGTAPIGFESASLSMAYDPDKGRVMLRAVQISSAAVSLRASGHIDMQRADGARIAAHLAGEMPSSFVAQLQIDSLRVERPEIFARPVEFTQGIADLRLRLAPFSLEVGQFSLTDGDLRVAGSAQFAAENGSLRRAVDMTATQFTAQKLLGAWPKSFARGTRDWLDRNLLGGDFSNFRFALRQAAGAPAPVIEASYNFANLIMTPMASLPAITHGTGYGVLRGHSLTTVLEAGRTTPPLGGDLDLAGSVFTIDDVRARPATGRLTLQSAGDLTATLSLIDQPPFRFVSKSGRDVDLGRGAARLTTQITLPLQKIVTADDITLNVTGTVEGFSSENLARGREVLVPQMQVFVDKAGLRLTGEGTISAVTFDGAFVQPFGKETNGAAQITANVDLTPATLAAFGVQLPQGTVAGAGRGEVVIDLARNSPPRMVLTSDLNGLALALPPIGYAKPAAQTGQLRAEITLSSPPDITRLDLQAGDLQARGRVALNGDGTLARAQFAGLRLGEWLDADVTLSRPNAGAPLGLTLGNGALDLRFFPPARAQIVSGGTAQPTPITLPISLRLDALRVTDAITLSQFTGEIAAQSGGLAGNFSASLAGGALIAGTLAPSQHGTAVRITSNDAGAALAQAGVYSAARGGALDVVLTPTPQRGTYAGEVQMANIRVQNASVLAELLNAVSVVGLLDQLGGAGILFNAVTGRFTLSPSGVDIAEGVATGGSLGVTMQGIYRFDSSEIDMQGVISPVYILNGIGAVISRRGEGLLGFNYRLSGAAAAPRVRVNALSVLMPGFLRDMFKSPPAQLSSPP